jgi:hypothetical protein
MINIRVKKLIKVINIMVIIVKRAKRSSKTFREELTHRVGCSSGKDVHTGEDVLPGRMSTLRRMFFREGCPHWGGCSSGKKVHTDEDVLPGRKSTHTPGRKSTFKERISKNSQSLPSVLSGYGRPF